MECVDDIHLRVETKIVERKKRLGGELWEGKVFIGTNPGLGKELLDCRERRKRLQESSRYGLNWKFR
jgi:hypothetical protein